MIVTVSNKIVTKELSTECTDTIRTVPEGQTCCILETITKKGASHTTKIHVQDNATVTYFLLLVGGDSLNMNIEIALEGNGSRATVLGVYFGAKDDHYRFNVSSIHSGSNSSALTWINGILTANSSSHFDGLVKIVPGIYKVNSYLANHVLVLGDRAQANAIPSLEIESNDVKCSHEATIGQIDHEHVFYLMSRGLTRESATSTIIDGFFESVSTKIEDPHFRKLVRERIMKEISGTVV